MKPLTASAIALILCAIPVSAEGTTQKTVPIYRVTVVERTTKAINYNYRSGLTKIDFRGTVLLPAAKGEATVESKRGRTEIDANFEKLTAPQRFGREYLTYVLWAITPEGGPRNIGEIIPGTSDRAHLEVTTDLQAFALIVTAEPYSAVRQPSDVVVLENQVRSDTTGKIQELSAKYELMPRGHYTLNEPGNLPSAEGPKVSMREYEALLAIYQAQNALGIASAVNAAQYAPNTFAKAQQLLGEAQQWQVSKNAEARVVQTAREATQTAEDARAIAVQRRQAERLANAELEATRAQQAKAQADMEVQRARNDAENARFEVEAERIARQRAETQAAISQSRAAHAEADANRTRALSSVGTTTISSSVEKTRLRMRLLEDLNGVVVTRDTPRGLVATIPDSEFHGANLRGTASEQAARIASVVAAYPGLRVNVEGHSGGEAGERLSIDRSQAVRDALLRRGLSPDLVSAAGFGNSRPIGPGVVPNQRVEIVIYGEPIGVLPFWDRTYSLIPR